jgi:hypothetical protein
LRQHGERETQTGQRRAQVVGDAGQHIRALRQEAQNPLLHPVEGKRRTPDLARALWPDRAAVAAHAEGLRRTREPADAPHLDAEKETGDDDEQDRGAADPAREDVERPGPEPLARHVDIHHAVVQLNAHHDEIGVRDPVHVEGQADMLAQRVGEIIIHGPDDVDLVPQHELLARLEGHAQLELPLDLVDDAELHRRVRAAVELVEAEGDLPGNAEGEAARDDAEMAAVEDLQHHRFQQQHRQQDDEQAAREEPARQKLPEETLGRRGDPPPLPPHDLRGAHIPGLST